jgi:hypothetical protein
MVFTPSVWFAVPQVGPAARSGALNRYFWPVGARCTGRSGQEAARVASGAGLAGEMAVAGCGQGP